MRLCTDCLHLDDRQVKHCPSCGGDQFAEATGKGEVVAVPAGAGMPCQNCYEVERELRLRYYRRVLSFVIAARVSGEAGYYCASCRRRRFGANFGFTMLLGWWGLLSLFLYNPHAILVNLWALFAPPFGAEQLGAMNVNDIRADAAEHAERQERLADVYMRMPGWLESLEEEDIELVLREVDYYAVLAVARESTHVEIKAAFREQAKRHHPDIGVTSSHDQMIAISDAYKVLGDERLRHAYDHRDELIAFLRDIDHVDGGGPHEDFLYGCEHCELGFYSFDDAADHCEEQHPGRDYSDLLVRFVEDDDTDEPAGTGPPEDGWRCKACAAVFADHGEAIAHADGAHPERTVVDVRRAVERV
jgi:hypothetical protein